MRGFEYFRPQSPVEACQILLEQGPGALALAGGTDLLVKIRRGALRPTAVVDLTGLEELKFVRQEKGWLRIGALTPLREVAASELLREKAGLLARAAGLVGSRQIRNLATIGGNLCNAAPSADTAAPLLALEARARLLGPAGEREVPVAEFFRGPGRTCLGPGEILAEVSFPEPVPGTRGVYLKHTRRQAMDIAVVGVAAVVEVDGERQEVRAARLALASVAPTPLRVAAAEQALAGLSLEDAAMVAAGVQRAAGLAREAARPIDDVRASATYRRHLVEVLVRRALQQVLDGKVA